MASSRKKLNRAAKLKNNDGAWIEGQENLCKVVLDYFTEFFAATATISNSDQFLDGINILISPEQNEDLTRVFSLEHFKRVINQMHSDKSLGPDGYNPTFYQKCWGTLGEEIFTDCMTWLERGEFSVGLNHTYILIPKFNSPQTMRDLRSISLCNVLYKIIPNVLCERLKEVLPDLVYRA